jgi:hypothetical protein
MNLIQLTMQSNSQILITQSPASFGDVAGHFSCEIVTLSSFLTDASFDTKLPLNELERHIRRKVYSLEYAEYSFNVQDVGAMNWGDVPARVQKKLIDMAPDIQNGSVTSSEKLFKTEDGNGESSDSYAVRVVTENRCVVRVYLITTSRRSSIWTTNNTAAAAAVSLLAATSVALLILTKSKW